MLLRAGEMLNTAVFRIHKSFRGPPLDYRSFFILKMVRIPVTQPYKAWKKVTIVWQAHSSFDHSFVKATMPSGWLQYSTMLFYQKSCF